LLDRFLHHHFARDQVLLDRVTQLRAVGALALRHDLLDDRVGARRRNGFAVHHGEVLCERRRVRKRCGDSDQG